MLTTAPVPVSLTSPTANLNTPGNQPWASVVISNLSPFLLQIQGGVVGGAAWLEPFTAMLYAVTGTHAPIVVEAQQLAGVSSSTAGGSQVQATWYGPGEEPQGAWPVSLTAQAVVAAVSGLLSVQGQEDVLVNNAAYTPGSPLPLLFDVNPAPHSYNAIIVEGSPTSGGSPLAVQLINFNSGARFSAPMGYDVNVGAASRQSIIPCANAVGDHLQVAIYMPGAGAGTVSVIGQTTGPVPQMRADGRAYPMGALNASASTAGAGAGTLVAASAAPIKILIQSLHVQATGNFGDIAGTIRGSAAELLGVPTAGGVAVLSPPGGVLIDAGQPVSYNLGAIGRATAYFDLVV